MQNSLTFFVDSKTGESRSAAGLTPAGNVRNLPARGCGVRIRDGGTMANRAADGKSVDASTARRARASPKLRTGGADRDGVSGDADGGSDLHSIVDVEGLIVTSRED